MKVRILTAALAATVLLFTQCKKDDAAPEPPVVTKDYAPMTTGSTFTFRDSLNGTGKEYTLTVTGTDSVANGKTYKKLSGSDTTVRFRAKVGANYYQLASFSGLGIASFEDNYLNDSLATGDIWQQTTAPFTVPGSGTTATATLKYKIAAKGISLTVNGINYTDVINVQLAGLSVTASGFTLPITASGNYYYAKGVGVIQGNLNVPAQTIGFPPVLSIPIPAYKYSQILLSSNIK